MEKKIRPKERDSILQSIRAGVVPRIGLHHIQVGRSDEVKAIINDLERISDGGSSIRLIIGDYGSGKTFFLHLIRTIAQEKGLVTAYADLNPDRRLHATAGQARNLFSELMRNVSTRTKPDGGALSSIVEKFISSAISESRISDKSVESIVFEKLKQLTEMTNGYDFAEVISAYWKGHDSGNEQLKSDSIRWLRGEFSTKTDSKNALGVRTIIDDGNVYDHLKLLAKFVKIAGYNGLLVCYDEMVNLYKLSNSQARNSNYEQILRILNDSLQGIAVGLGFIMCGTPEFLMDTRRGLYSYQALQSRLAENRFAKAAGVIDYSGTSIHLANLVPEDIYVLLQNIRTVFFNTNGNQIIPDEGLKAFMSHCSNRIGEAYFRTPRTTIKTFVDLLSVLEQNTNISWENLIEEVPIEADKPNEIEIFVNEDVADNNSGLKNLDQRDDDELSSIKL